MTDVVRLSPESFQTLFLRKQDDVILTTEAGRRITIKEFIPDEWKAIRLYDFEAQMNENKREIVLIDKIYRNQIVEEFRRSLRE